MPDVSTRAHLRSLGFSENLIESFLRPFFAGIFLEPRLETSARFFDFVFKMFATGRAAIPAEGMGAIPRQLASAVPDGSVLLNTPVAALENGDSLGVRLRDGHRIDASAVVSATAGFDVRSNGDRSAVEWRSVTCLYFAAPRAPVADGILVLNGESTGPVNNLCVMDQVADTYAPPGTHLVSVTVLEDHADEPGIVPLVRDQLERWFGPDVKSWTRLETYRIGQALPRFDHGQVVPDAESRIRPGVYVCGDHTANPSLQAALRSGRKAAEAVIEDRARRN